MAMVTDMVLSGNVLRCIILSTDQWVKRDTNTGQFIDVNQNGKPHKGVTKE